MENPLFAPRLPLFLAGIFLLFWLIGVAAMWLRLAGEPSMTKGVFVGAWLAVVGLVSFFALPLGRAVEIAPLAISAAMSLAFVYFATTIGGTTPRGWRALALAGGVAIVAAVIFPLCALFAAVLLGIDGP